MAEPSSLRGPSQLQNRPHPDEANPFLGTWISISSCTIRLSFSRTYKRDSFWQEHKLCTVNNAALIEWCSEEGAVMSARLRTLMFALILPYFGLAVYFALRLPQKPLPEWLPYLGAFYIFATILLVVLASQRLSRGSIQQRANPRPAPAGIRGRVLGLLLSWCALLSYGTFKTLEGEIPLERAAPAGAILLSFIGLFIWLLYRDTQARSTRDINR